MQSEEDYYDDDIIQIIPVTVPTVAVYVLDNNELIRDPVHIIALTRGGDISFYDTDKTGYFSPSNGASNFLGFEFNGNQQNWDEEVRLCLEKKRKARKTSTNEEA